MHFRDSPHLMAGGFYLDADSTKLGLNIKRVPFPLEYLDGSMSDIEKIKAEIGENPDDPESHFQLGSSDFCIDSSTSILAARCITISQSIVDFFNNSKSLISPLTNFAPFSIIGEIFSSELFEKSSKIVT